MQWQGITKTETKSLRHCLIITNNLNLKHCFLLNHWKSEICRTLLQKNATYIFMYLHLFQGTGNVGKSIISLQAFSNLHSFINIFVTFRIQPYFLY